MIFTSRSDKRLKAISTVVASQIPGVALRHLDGAERALLKLSFYPVARLSSSSHKSRTDIVLLRTVGGDQAMVAVVMSQMPNTPRRVSQFVVFRSDLTQDSTVTTSNSSAPRLYVRGPSVVHTACPTTTDLSILYAVHQYRLRSAFGDTPAYDADALLTDPLECMQNDHVRSHDRMIAAGYQYYDRTRDSYRYTVVGAIRAGWMMLPPLKQWNAWKCRRAEARLLQKVLSSGRGAQEYAI